MNDTSIDQGPVIRVSSGLVRGAAVDGVSRFLSIPYAASPVGELRFHAPISHPVWDGERDATSVGSSSPQNQATETRLSGLDLAPLFSSPWTPDKDFLTANIWTPDTGATGLPVMVFVHGGAFLAGGKDTPLYDGTAFARSGVVLVSINYRMGLEGFVHIPGADSNLGLRDVLAALGWVRENAPAFGGDPDNITVFGESAGAMIIADLVTSPLSKRLFRRAIVQSGHGAMVRPVAAAERLTRRLARLLKVSPDVDGFRSRSIQDGLKTVEAASKPTLRLNLRDDDGRDPTFGLSKFLPVWGDEVLPKAPLAALADGAGADIDLLIGSNREEMNLYFVPTGVKAKTSGLLARFVLSRSQRNAGKILKDYGLGQKGKRAGHVLSEAMHDLVFRWPARRFAEEHKGRTHVYEFDWRSPTCGGELGACHGLELPFVFNTLPAVTAPDGLAGSEPPQALADKVHQLWVGFARDGSLPWPEYRGSDRQVYTLSTGVSAPEAPPPAAKYLP